MVIGKVLGGNGEITEIERTPPTPEQQAIFDKKDRIKEINIELAHLDNKLSKTEYQMIKAGQITALTAHQIEYFDIKDALIVEKTTLLGEI